MRKLRRSRIIVRLPDRRSRGRAGGSEIRPNRLRNATERAVFVPFDGDNIRQHAATNSINQQLGKTWKAKDLSNTRQRPVSPSNSQQMRQNPAVNRMAPGDGEVSGNSVDIPSPRRVATSFASAARGRLGSVRRRDDTSRRKEQNVREDSSDFWQAQPIFAVG